MSSQRRVQRTRTEILDRAWILISEQGADVSLDKIAKTAGVSRQSIYDHFGSRGGLILALVRRTDERLDIESSLFAAFELNDPQQRLKETIDVWIRFVQAIYPVATDLIRLRKTDEDASAAWEDRMSDLRTWLKVLTKSLQKDGALQPVWSAQTASEFLWASFSVQMWGLLTEECGWDAQDASNVLKRTLCQTLLNPES